MKKAKTNSFLCSLPPLPGEGSAAGEEGRGGEGLGGAAPAGSENSYGSETWGAHQNSNRVRKKSEIRIAIDATTTAAVVERPTPSAPPVV